MSIKSIQSLKISKEICCGEIYGIDEIRNLKNSKIKKRSKMI